MIKNAQIKGVGVNPVGYHSQTVLRGDKNFVMSSSYLRGFWKCPSKWMTPIDDGDGKIYYYDQDSTKATEYGNLFDCFVLTPEQITERYVLIPDDAPTKPTKKQINAKKPSDETLVAIAWWRRFNDDLNGREILAAKDIKEVTKAAGRFMATKPFNEYIENSQVQVHIIAEWHDKETGIVVPTQCLMDILPKLGTELGLFDPRFEKSVIDIKTTRNASIRSWESWAHTAGYQIQAAWNMDHTRAATGRDFDRFLFMLSENTPPYETGRREMLDEPGREGGGDVNDGRLQYEIIMKAYCKCLKHNKWPGFDDNDISSEGWTEVRPNPYDQQRRQFGPKFAFDDDEEVGEPAEMAEHPESGECSTQ